MKIYFFVLIVLSSSLSFSRDESAGMGEVALEFKRYADDGNPLTEEDSQAVFSQLESSYKVGNWRAMLRGYARVEQKETDRNIIALEELWGQYRFSGSRGNELTRVTAGYQLFNWSVLELFHPVDVINARNFDSDLEKWEKLGELALTLEHSFFSLGELQWLLLPQDKSPKFPGPHSPMAVAPGVKLERAQFFDEKGEKTSQRWSLQGGLRLNLDLGGSEVSFHFLQHKDRSQPIISFVDENQFWQSPLAPYFFSVRQYGGTFTTILFDGLLLKGEGVYRQFLLPESAPQKTFLTPSGLREPHSHGQVAVGLEKSWSYADGSSSSLYIEHQEVLLAHAEAKAQLQIFQSDTFLGIRYALNDVEGKEFFAGMVFDRQRRQEKMFFGHFTQRLSDVWKIKTGVKIISLENYHKKNQVFFNLSRYF